MVLIGSDSGSGETPHDAALVMKRFPNDAELQQESVIKKPRME